MKKLSLLIAIALMAEFNVKADNATNTLSSTNAATAKAVVKPYPLKTCLVCGMELGMMGMMGGKPYEFVYKGQKIKLCNAEEKELFDKAPDKYLKKLADAEAKLNNKTKQ